MSEFINDPALRIPTPENETPASMSVHDWENALERRYPADKRHPRVRARLSEVLAEVRANADEGFILEGDRLKRLDKLVNDYADGEDDTVLPLILAELKLD